MKLSIHESGASLDPINESGDHWPGDGGGQAEGEEDEAEPEEELGLQVFLWRYSGPEVGVDDVHRHIEHDHVGGEGGEGHGDFDQSSEAAQSNDSLNLTEGSNLQLVSGKVQ